MARIEPNVWTPREAADWCGISYRILLNLLDTGTLPAIRVGSPKSQKMPTGRARRRSASKWLIPTQAFKRAWEAFTPAPTPAPKRAARRAA